MRLRSTAPQITIQTGFTFDIGTAPEALWKVFTLNSQNVPIKETISGTIGNS